MALSASKSTILARLYDINGQTKLTGEEITKMGGNITFHNLHHLQPATPGQPNLNVGKLKSEVQVMTNYLQHHEKLCTSEERRRKYLADLELIESSSPNVQRQIREIRGDKARSFNPCAVTNFQGCGNNDVEMESNSNPNYNRKQD